MKSKRLKLASVKKVFAAIGVTLTLLATLATQRGSGFIKSKLASLEEQMQFFQSMEVDTSYLSYNQTEHLPFSYNTRQSPPPSGTIKVNFLIDDLSEFEKAELKRAIDDIDDIFDNINPQYNLEANFAPTFSDKLNPSNIDVTEGVLTDMAGYWYGTIFQFRENGMVTSNSIIKLDKKNGKNYTTMAHELLHHFGLGDGYQVPDKIKTNSIMSGDIFIRKNDVALLAGKYGDITNENSKEKLKDYVMNYEKNQDWHKKITEIFQSEVNVIKNEISYCLHVDENDISFQIADGNYICYRKNDDSLYSMLTKTNGLKFNSKSYFINHHDSDIHLNNEENLFFVDQINGINTKYSVSYVNGKLSYSLLYYFTIKDNLYYIGHDLDGSWFYSYVGTKVDDKDVETFNSEYETLKAIKNPNRKKDIIDQILNRHVDKQNEIEAN